MGCGGRQRDMGSVKKCGRSRGIVYARECGI